MIVQIVADLIDRIRLQIEGDSRITSELYTSYRFVYGPERCCHRTTIELIHAAARELPGVSRVTGNRTLNVGRSPRWKPDAVLWDVIGNPLCAVEFEYLNSSDQRIIDKDVSGYLSFIDVYRDHVPLLIITSLPEAACPHYALKWTSLDCYNWAHVGKSEEVRRNPFEYWYAHYRVQLGDRLVDLPIYFANFRGHNLHLVDKWPEGETMTR